MIVVDAVVEDAWDDPASIEIHRGQIIVNQTRERHWKVQDALQSVRRDVQLGRRSAHD